MPSAIEPDNSVRSSWSLETLRLGALMTLLGVALFRCVSLQVPQRVFDIDPMLALMPQSAVGPAFGLALDALVLFAAGVALVAERRARRGVDVRLLALALLPVVPVLVHGAFAVGDLSRGMTWFAAMIGAVALGHLARDARLRRIAIAALLAAIAPLALRGAEQIFIEHPATVAHYEATREAFLADRGWAPDSAAARLYERRLVQPEATGWFGLSNVYSTLLAAGVVALLGALRLRDLRGNASGVGLVVLLAGAAAAIVLLINGSKGALGATVIGIAVALVVTLPPTIRYVLERAAPRWMVGIVGVALLAVAARGILLPESFADERSLLFRWHYLVNTVRIVPAAPFVGVGPDGFQDAYVAVRSERHVEEVTNAHSVLFDWIAALGVFAWAWVILALFAVRRAASELTPYVDSPATIADDPIASRTGRLAALAVLPAGFAGIAVEIPTLDGQSYLLRILGVGVWAALAAALGAHRVGYFATLDSTRRWALLGAVAALAAHAQIEMTLWLAGSVGWVAAFVAVVATARRRIGRPVLVMGGIGVIFVVAGIALWMSMRVAATDRAMIEAAVPLERLGVARTALRVAAEAPQATATDRVEVAFRTAGVAEPTIAMIVERLHHPDPGQRAVGQRTAIEALREREHEVRIKTAEALEAVPRFGRDARPLVAASNQWMRLAAMAAPERRDGPLRRAVEAAELALETAPRLRMWRQRADALDAVARTQPSHDAWVAAALAWRDVVRLDPHGLGGLLRFAEAAWAAGDAVEAERAWKHALDVDEALALDPPRQLSAERRREVLRRLAAISPPKLEPWTDEADREPEPEPEPEPQSDPQIDAETDPEPELETGD